MENLSYNYVATKVLVSIAIVVIVLLMTRKDWRNKGTRAFAFFAIALAAAALTGVNLLP